MDYVVGRALRQEICCWANIDTALNIKCVSLVTVHHGYNKYNDVRIVANMWNRKTDAKMYLLSLLLFSLFRMKTM